MLEEQRALQDAFDGLQAEAKFDADQNGQQLEDSRQDNGRQQAKISVSLPLLTLSYTHIHIYTVCYQDTAKR